MPGLENKGADALSCIHESGEMTSLIHVPEWLGRAEVIEEVHKDVALQKVIYALKENKPVQFGFSYVRGVLLYEGRLFHSTPQGGYSGFHRTFRRVALNVYWIGMKKTMQECDTCQRQKYVAAAPGGLLQPLPILEQIW
ncbi:uncharacterized protein [Cicer arietinum]|uniref:uncharacterized protein n=1 Tax=Cicer arietinum TaxID=3827 RepID=UPI003CC6C3BF